MRVNPTFGAVNDLTSDDAAVQASAIAALFIEWNWVDADGAPLPQPPDGVRLADTGAVAAALTAWRAAVDRRQAAAALRPRREG
jgi:hypothetical protein